MAKFAAVFFVFFVVIAFALNAYNDQLKEKRRVELQTRVTPPEEELITDSFPAVLEEPAEDPFDFAPATDNTTAQAADETGEVTEEAIPEEPQEITPAHRVFFGMVSDISSPEALLQGKMRLKSVVFMKDGRLIHIPQPPQTAQQDNIGSELVSIMRQRYELNNINKQLVLQHFRNNATRKDMDVLRQLAAVKDRFAMAALAYIESTTKGMSGEPYKNAALEGEVFSMTQYGSFLIHRYQTEEGELLLKKAAEKGYYFAFRALISLYNTQGRTDEFCPVAVEGYRHFGLEMFSADFGRNDGAISKAYFECGLFQEYELKPEEPDTVLLERIDTEEARLLLGFVDMSTGHYQQAASVFETLSGKGSRVGNNAKYCLGVLNYYGRGVPRNEQKAMTLMRITYDSGVFSSARFVYGEYRPAPPGKRMDLIDYAYNRCN